MSDNVLAQLQQVDAELAAKEAQVVAQIKGLHEKRCGIQTVIAMYSEKDDETESPARESAKTKKAVASAANSSAAVTKKAAKPKAAKTEKKAKKATAAKTSTTKQKKKDGRTASWQKYTRPGVNNESIPDAVKLILETQPKNEFKIADVMTALFKDDMPKTQYLKARNRISNVLSGGVRAGDWFKGTRGTYRMTAGA